MELSGNYKGFSIKPLIANEQTAASRTPIRPAPCPPPVGAAVPGDNASRGQRLQIGQPVLDATTSLAVRELVSVPLKPAPPLPTAARPVSTIVVDSKNSVGGGGGGGYPTLRRITSFMKNQKSDERKPTAPRVNSKFDKEVLKSLEISQPILQNEINVPSEPLPLEADQRKAVVLRAQSLRNANNTKHRPSVPNFGSMRSKRPTSVAAVAAAAAVCSRPTSPPPQPPPPTKSQPPHGGYQIPRPPSDRRSIHPTNVLPLRNDCGDGGGTHLENIYSVIDENPAANADDDSTYKVPRSLDSSLLGEIVSAIQERNHESIYTSKSAAANVDGPQQQQQTYENVNSSSPPSSTTSSGYLRPVDLKSRAASYDRPDLVKNCDENRSFNRSPDVLDAKMQQTATDKPIVLFPKPVVGVAVKPSVTATVGLKKKLSDGRQPSKVVANIQKRFEKPSNMPKSPRVVAKSTITGNR